MYCDWPVLGRCCFCMPLRKGILLFGYINMFFNALMIGLYSYAVNAGFRVFAIYHGASFSIPAELCVAIYCVEILLNSLLLYGTHRELMLYIKIYYYFAITTIVGSILVQIIEISITMSDSYRGFSLATEVIPFMIAAICVQIYIIMLVKSLLRKLEISAEPNVYDNPLQQIVYEGKPENNGVYDSTVVPVQVEA